MSPEACLEQARVEIRWPAPPEQWIKYHSDGSSYVLGMHATPPARDRTAHVTFVSKDARWSYEDYAAFQRFLPRGREDVRLGFICFAVQADWVCRSPAD